MLRSPSLFEDAVKMLLTTNCSWAATRGMVDRLIRSPAEGPRVSDSCGRREDLRGDARESRALRLPRRGVAALRATSGVRTLDLPPWEDPDRPSEEVREAIVAEHGFGPYAAEGLMRVLGRHDFFALDSWTRQQFRKHHPGPAKVTDRSIARRYGRFGTIADSRCGST